MTTLGNYFRADFSVTTCFTTYNVNTLITTLYTLALKLSELCYTCLVCVS